MKKIAQMFSWEFILLFYLSLTALFLLSGCASYVTTTVGDHTVRTGFHLQYEAKEDNE